MLAVKRSDENPILSPDKKNFWEAEAAFNGCVVKSGKNFHMVYRAMSARQKVYGNEMELSTVGHAVSGDGINFEKKEQFIKPEYDWERFGCEDPRVTEVGGKYYIFYTALSTHPFTPEGIKVGLAITRDFKTIDEKHPVTNFNSKAMALFPDKVNGKFAAILAANTDKPPVKIGLAFFDKESDIWSPAYWDKWYKDLDKNSIDLKRKESDHFEVGAPPIKTEKGWLFVYSYIKNYFSPPPVFGIEAVLLDLKNPFKVIGRTKNPLLIPDYDYELYGKVPNIVFPTGALIEGEELFIYYGAADTRCALATVNIDELVRDMLSSR